MHDAVYDTEYNVTYDTRYTLQCTMWSRKNLLWFYTEHVLFTVFDVQRLGVKFIILCSTLCNINNINEYKQKWIAQHFNVFIIYLLLFFIRILTFIFYVEHFLLIFFSFFKRRNRDSLPSLPSLKKNTTQDVLLQSVMTVVVFFTETSSKPNWIPQIVNWMVTQFRIKGQYGIGFKGRRWSGVTLPRPFSKQLTLQKQYMQCIYFCSNSYLLFAA